MHKHVCICNETEYFVHILCVNSDVLEQSDTIVMFAGYQNLF